jgi:hypothetical protein
MDASNDKLAKLSAAVRFAGYTGGLTHHFYHYPARFSPEFARTVIEEFSRPNDVVLDPFMGGGTSIVEGLVLRRRMIGVDVNALGRFVADVRTTPLSRVDEGAILSWAERAADSGKRREPEVEPPSRKYLPRSSHAFLSVALEEAATLRGRQNAFARCVLLRLGQWAVDCRDHTTPRRASLSRKLVSLTSENLAALRDFVGCCTEAGLERRRIRMRRILLHRSCVGLIRFGGQVG